MYIDQVGFTHTHTTTHTYTADQDDVHRPGRLHIFSPTIDHRRRALFRSLFVSLFIALGAWVVSVSSTPSAESLKSELGIDWYSWAKYH